MTGWVEPDITELEARHAHEAREFLAARNVSHWADLRGKARDQYNALMTRQAGEVREAYGRDPTWGEKTPERLRSERKSKDEESGSAVRDAVAESEHAVGAGSRMGKAGSLAPAASARSTMRAKR